MAVGGRPGEIYNIGGGTELSNIELTRRLLELVGASEAMVERVADRRHDRRYCVDWSKIRAELGYRPQVEFDDGLRRTVEWYKRNRVWWKSMSPVAA